MSAVAKATGKTITLSMPALMHERLSVMARAADVKVGVYAQALFNAAYAARCNTTGDVDLDTAVARLVILAASGDYDTADLAVASGLSEPTVQRMLDTWRGEVFGRAV